jgi:nucleoside permease NupC
MPRLEALPKDSFGHQCGGMLIAFVALVASNGILGALHQGLEALGHRPSPGLHRNTCPLLSQQHAAILGVIFQPIAWMMGELERLFQVGNLLGTRMVLKKSFHSAWHRSETRRHPLLHDLHFRALGFANFGLLLFRWEELGRWRPRVAIWRR